MFTLGGFTYFPVYDFPPFSLYLSKSQILCAQCSPAFPLLSLLQSSTIEFERFQILGTNIRFARRSDSRVVRVKNWGKTIFKQVLNVGQSNTGIECQASTGGTTEP